MKNPWMSAWLSAANQAASASRGFYAAEFARQQKAWMEQMQQAWLSALPGAAKPAKKRSSHRRSS